MTFRAVAAAALARRSPRAVWAFVSRPDGRLHVTVLNTGIVDGGPGAAERREHRARRRRLVARTLLAALGRVLPPATSHLDMVVITGGEKAAVDGLDAPARVTTPWERWSLRAASIPVATRRGGA